MSNKTLFENWRNWRISKIMMGEGNPSFLIWKSTKMLEDTVWQLSRNKYFEKRKKHKNKFQGEIYEAIKLEIIKRGFQNSCKTDQKQLRLGHEVLQKKIEKHAYSAIWHWARIFWSFLWRLLVLIFSFRKNIIAQSLWKRLKFFQQNLTPQINIEFEKLVYTIIFVKLYYFAIKAKSKSSPRPRANKDF